MRKQSKRSVPRLMLLGALTYAFFMRPRLLTWGTQLGEAERQLPGDDYIAEPTLQSTYALDIEAPVAAVYPWLAQMGREGTGFYTPNSLSANILRQDLAPLEVGTKLDNGLKVLQFEAPHCLLYGNFNVSHLLGSYSLTRLYLLEAHAAEKTRLLVRTRLEGNRVYSLLREPFDFVMLISQLMSIRDLTALMP